ncbi:XRE family transcriptional regulator [Streptomyces alboflavus]|uniref:XRE family transcriptional regulator n=1 Tax=Streptomyces alboflavus TaxID=67267 RepID=A0A1Z1WPN7_9ACTN|nr:XRE family transcriptional regulator [Streptomyces alboflavus]
MIVDTVGELLRQWRRRRQLSQLDLALAADVSARHVSLVETGRSRPSADMVLRLADQLDVPLRERNRLLLAAGFAPRYAERPLGDDALAGRGTRSSGCCARTSRTRPLSSTAGGTSC